MENGVERQRVVVVGQGYVGLPLAMRAVEAGFDVVGLEVDTEKIVRLADGSSMVEDISDAQLRAALASGRYLPTTDPRHAEGFDIAVISVPTPPFVKVRPTFPTLSGQQKRLRCICVRVLV